MSDLKKIQDEFLTKLNKKLNQLELNQIKSDLFGKNGLISSQFKKISSVAESERKNFALDLNIIKNELQESIEFKLKEIEKRMSEIIDKDVKTRREVWERQKAVKHFKKIGEKYKAEIIESIPKNEELSVYHHGDTWHDLCRGPHLESSGKIGKAFKLTKVSGAYWRGDSKNEMLQRIYGTSWASQKDLDDYLSKIKAAVSYTHLTLPTT